MRLDDAYANAAYIPNGSGYPDIWADLAQEFREVEIASGRALLNQPYGDGYSFDVFTPSPRPKGCVIFIHGGFWRAFGRKDWSHLAAGVMEQGWACAMPSYPLCPDATIPQITHAVRDAVVAVSKRFAGPLALVGHSAGGHLVARMAMDDVDLPKDVRNRIHHSVAMSPLGDLRDMLDTTMNDDFGLDLESAIAESPTLGQKTCATPVTVWVGADERPAFLKQAADLAQAWAADHRVVPNRHHFDVIEDLCDPNSVLVSLLTGGNP